MNFFRDLPIRRKLTLLFMLISGITSILGCVIMLAYGQITMRHEIARDLSVLTDMYDDNVASGLVFDDVASLKATLKSLDGNPHILAAAVYSKTGAIIARYERLDLKTPFPFPRAQVTQTRFEQDRLDGFRHVLLDNEQVGTIYISSDLKELSAQFWRYVTTMGFALLGTLLVAYLLSSKLQTLISDPITDLAAVTAMVASKKDFTIRAGKRSGDEFGKLIDAFNAMLGEIQSRDAALQESNDHLESRVQERTSELQAEIAERKRTEEVLCVQEERTRSIVEQAFDAIITTDLEDRIIDWNGQAERTFGWSRSEVMARGLGETILTPELRQAHFSGISRFLATGETSMLGQRSEVIGLHKDGHNLSIELAIAPIRVGDGFLFNAFVRDITERKKSESELHAAHKQLVDLSRQAGMAEVATSVLHNVGNVLNSVNVSATLMSDQIKNSRAKTLPKVVALLEEHTTDLAMFLTCDPKGKQLPRFLRHLSQYMDGERVDLVAELDLLRKNVEHINEIVAMQQSNAKFSGARETVKVVELVEDALRMNSTALARHRIKVIRRFEASDVEINVEKHEVLQILVNLIRNAQLACTESCRTEKELTVRVTSEDATVRIAVIDNGVGILPENLTRIFGHGFTTRKDGHGFGLHSGALGAKKMGGGLQVHSAGREQGATFILELPLQVEFA